MIVDLHSHYPMHFFPDGKCDESDSGTLAMKHEEFWKELSDHEKHFLIALGDRMMHNYFRGRPRVQVETLLAGDVGVALSPLYQFFDEIAGAQLTGLFPATGQVTWPKPARSYVENLLEQMDFVEQHIGEKHAASAQVARDAKELEALVAQGKLALVHAVEGGFALGGTPDEIESGVGQLARRGVAYVTVAHLFYRQVAANVPPLPSVPALLLELRKSSSADAWSQAALPVPQDVGLTSLGRALVESLVSHGVLLDLTHMSPRAMDDTLGVLDQRDPENAIPVLVSHGAYRFGSRQYNLTDEQIVRVAERKGTIGLIVCRQFTTDGLPETQALRVLSRHVERIAEVVEAAKIPGVEKYDCISIGTDLDGFIEPLQGIETAADLREIEDGFAQAFPEGWKKICSENALRVLRAGLACNVPVNGRVPWAPMPD